MKRTEKEKNRRGESDSPAWIFRGSRRGGALSLMALVFVAYLPALQGDFIWDDDSYVTDNPMLRDGEGLGRIWTETSATPQYYPLTHTTFWIEYRLWGLRPLGYHIVNILLHGASAVLLWIILGRLGVPGAWLGAALFALHPVQVESVAWITERKNVLSGFFYLASLLAYLGFALKTERGASGNRTRWERYALSLVLFGAGLLSKTVTATLPVALFLILWWKRERLRVGDIAPLVPMVMVGGAAGSLTAFLERGQIGAVGAEWSMSFLDHILLACRIPWFYLGKLLWPVELTFIYERWEIRSTVATAYLYPAGLVALFLLLWLRKDRWGKGPLVAFAYFVITLGPALGFVSVYPMRYSFVADHFQYMACLGPLALAAALLVHSLRRRTAGAAMVLTGAFLLGLSGFATWSHARAFRDLETLWRDTLRKNPTAWMAHNNLGALLGERGDPAGAMDHLSEAIRLKPDHAGARNNLGVVLARVGRMDEAVEQFREAAHLDPEDSGVEVRLGDALFRQGRMAEAADHLSRAVGLAPENLQARHLLGNVLAAQGRFHAAIPHYRQVLARLPDDPSTRLNLGIALARTGRLEEALEQMERARGMEPANVNILFNLGTLLLQTGRTEEAKRHLSEAVRIAPDFTDARRMLDGLR